MAEPTQPEDLSTRGLAGPGVAAGWFPIREVARLTGVNAVTLRAWERRYGLIVPHRTPKGHRLYAQEHVERVMGILSWLNRGVSVGQVKSLIDDPLPQQRIALNDWDALREDLLDAIRQLAERRLDSLCSHAMSLYPPRLICEQLLIPVLSSLDTRWQGQPGGRMARVFFLSWLRSKLGARAYHNNRQLSGAPVLLVNHSNLPLEPNLWLSAWLVSSADCPVEVFDWPLPSTELYLAAELLEPRAVLLYSSKPVEPAHLSRLLAILKCPLVIAGAKKGIDSDELGAQIEQAQGFWLAEDPLQAYAVLRRLRVI
jgi:DNA-binding transcriptional MerR regulator